jgi:hypothetical protein
MEYFANKEKPISNLEAGKTGGTELFAWKKCWIYSTFFLEITGTYSAIKRLF